ncbi:hypothetical protein DXD17_02670 [[Ruminococcus] lactaris]|jgi:hypothetical protein|uniref:Minor capsid protein n=1 Tax=[Ruminococcus] lactaris TaxID=46228 RepID=A0A3E4LWV5_9FIRM|nr:minor capsid protein [[Ruminococcus] lactaris]RGK41951.1 hypothetical protein DXD17_02670 [[Ruminococcus] lactaris]
MAKIKTRVTFDRAATIARIKAASNDALTDMGDQALMDASKHVPKDQGALENSGLSLSDEKAVEGIYTLRWNTPYARYLWHGDVMYGNPNSRTYGPEKISFTSALAHEEWAKYAKEIYGEEWKAVYQAALKEKMR